MDLNLMLITILVAVLALFGLVFGVTAITQLRSLRGRFDSTLGGVSTDSLETTLKGHLSRVNDVDKRLGELEAEYERLSVTNSVASQKIALVRFNPFGDTGGDQSFSLAVLDAHNSGYVLTSIHGRQGTRVYVKPVDFGKSKYSLSDEEQQALGLAEKRIPDLSSQSTKKA
jgi:hypothetical protein